MQKIKLISSLLVSFLMIILISACGSKGDLYQPPTQVEQKNADKELVQQQETIKPENDNQKKSQ